MNGSTPPERSAGLTGQCLCGGVRYATARRGGRVAVCHCDQCRRQSGALAMGVFDVGAVTVADPEGLLRWYRASAAAERGFCGRCGGHLLWRLRETGETSVTAGTLDDARGLEIGAHIHVERQPGFYAFADAAPRLTGAQAAAWFASGAAQSTAGGDR